MIRNWIAVAACAAGVVLAATACSSSSSSTAASPATSSATAQTSSPAAAASSPAATVSSAGLTVALQAIPGIPGKALVDGKGRAMYLWEADKSGTSTCTGACAAAWPPVTVTGTPNAGSGVNQGMLGTVKRADGTEQLTYNRHPLYYFVGDTGSGVAKGQGSKAFGAGWYVLSASGAKIDTD